MSAPCEAGRTLAMGQDEAVGGGRRSVEAPFGKALGEARRRSRPEIVGLTADLGKYTDILPFRDAFPDRFFNVGMAEQNLVAVAAGPGAHRARSRSPRPTACSPPAAPSISSPSPARTRNLNVKIIAGLPGLTTGYGGTHQAIEDLALMRMIPGLTIIDPCDATEIAAATAAIADHPGPVYMRLLRGIVPVVLEPGYRVRDRQGA